MPCLCLAISKKSITKEGYVTFIGVGGGRGEDKTEGNDTVLNPYPANVENRVS
jgi:hypothetical protein